MRRVLLVGGRAQRVELVIVVDEQGDADVLQDGLLGILVLGVLQIEVSELGLADAHAAQLESILGVQYL